MRDWKKIYEKELKSKVSGSIASTSQDGTKVVVDKLPSKKRGRPPLIGEKADEYLKKVIVAMRQRGTPIGTGVVAGIGHGILLKTDKYMLEE